MFFSQNNYNWLLKLAWMSNNWADTLVFKTLEKEYKLIINELIELSGKDNRDIYFWVQNEGVLRIINSVNWCLISVITPTDDIWRNYLYKS